MSGLVTSDSGQWVSDLHVRSGHELIRDVLLSLCSQGGWIVCEKDKDALLAGWEEEMCEQQRKDEARKQAKVYEHWRRMIKALLLRQKLRDKFDISVSS